MYAFIIPAMGERYTVTVPDRMSQHFHFFRDKVGLHLESAVIGSKGIAVYFLGDGYPDGHASNATAMRDLHRLGILDQVAPWRTLAGPVVIAGYTEKGRAVNPPPFVAATLGVAVPTA